MSSGIAGGLGMGINEAIFDYHETTDNGQELTVRITMQDRDPSTRAINERTKSIKFMSSAYGVDCVAKIAETFNMEARPDYGLYFLNKFDLTKCYWLDLTKTLRYYDVHNLDELVYKQVKQPLRILLMDGSRKVIMCDVSQPVASLVEVICAKQNISNPEEFSLMVAEDELTDEQRAAREKDLKRRRKRGEPVSDDEWLKADMTLNAQGVTADTTLLLKKKFFFYDASIDTSDPQTLSLLFEQLRDDVTSGALPVQFDEAILFAALMAQVVLGAHDPDRHRKGKIDVRPFVPIEFKKTKKLAEKVFQAHAKLGSMSVTDAKFRFIQLARSLDTFGITVFTVQEAIRNKKGKLTKKFQPILLGISKSHLFRLDAITKQPLEEAFALTQLRRWSPSKTSITLDYGDHKDEYYTVLTEEGQKISALIAGYIDIIMNQRRDRAKEQEADELRAIEEEVIAPSRAAGVARTTSARRTMTTSSVSRPGLSRRPAPGAAGSTTTGGQSLNKRSLDRELQSISALLAGAPVILADDLPDDLADLADDDDAKLTSLQDARDMLADILGDLALSGNDMIAAKGSSHDAVLTSAQRMQMLADELVTAAGTTAALLGAPEEMSDALANMQMRLAGVVAAAANDDDPEALADASRGLGAAIDSMLAAAAIPDASLLCMDDLLAAAGDLSSALGGMVGLNVSDKVDDPEAKAKLAAAEANVKALSDAMTNSVSMAGARVLDDKVQAALDVQQTQLQASIVDMLTLADVSGIDLADMDSLKAAAESLNDALLKLSESVADADEHIDRTADIAAASVALDTTIVGVVNAESRSQALAGAKTVSAEAAALGELAALEATSEVNPELKDELNQLSQNLASALEAFAAATANASTDKSEAATEALKDAALGVGDAARALRAAREQKRALTDLAKATKASVVANNTLLDELDAAGESSSPAMLKKTAGLQTKVQAPNEAAGKAAQLYLADPTSRSAQKELLESSKALLHPVSRLVVSAKSSSSGYVDPTDQEAVANSASKAGEKTALLKSAFGEAQGVCWDLDVEAALDRIQGVQGDLATAAASAADGSLPEKEFFENESAALAEMSFAMEALSSAAAVLVAAMTNLNPQDVGAAAGNAASNAAILASAVVTAQKCKEDAAARSNPVALERASDVAGAMADLLTAAEARHKSSSDSTAADAETAAAVAAFKDALAAMMATIPGVGACIRAEDAVASAGAAFDLASLPPLAGPLTDAMTDDLLAAARALSDALALLNHGAKSGSNSELERGADDLTVAFDALKTAAGTLAAALPTDGARVPLVTAVKAVAEAAAASARDARSLAHDADDEEAAGAAAASADASAAAVAELLAVAESASDGAATEFDAIIDALLATVEAKLKTESGATPSGASYPAALESLATSKATIADAVKALMETTKIASAPGQDALMAVAEPLPGALASLAAAIVDAAAALSSEGGESGASSSGSSSTTSGGLEPATAASIEKKGTAITGGVKALSKAAAGKPKAALKGAAALIKLANTLAVVAKDADESLVSHSKTLKAASSKLSKAAAKAAKSLSSGGEVDVAPVVAAASLLGAATRAVLKAANKVGSGSDGAGASSASGSGNALSPEGAALVKSARVTAEQLVAHVSAVKAWANKPKSAPAKSLVKSSGRKTGAALTKLEKKAQSAAPGQAELAAAGSAVDAAIESLEECSMAASVGDLTTSSKLTFATAKKRISDAIEALAEASGSLSGESEAMAAGANSVGAGATQLAKLVAAAAAAVTDEPDDCSAILAAGVAFTSELRAAIDAAGTGGDASAGVEAAGAALVDALATAGANAEGTSASGSSGADAVAHARDAILAAAEPAKDRGMTYKDYQSDIKSQGKKLGKEVPKRIMVAVDEVATLYAPLMASVAAAATSSSAPDELRAAGRALCDASIKLFEEAAELKSSPKDKALQAKVAKSASSKVAKTIAALLAAAKAEASAEKDAEEAAIAIEEALGELDTMSFMVTSGSLAAAEGTTYADHEAAVAKAGTKVGKALLKVEAASAGGDTGEATKGLAESVSKLLASLEAGVPALADLSAQQALLDAAKALTEALAAFATSSLELASDPQSTEAAAAAAEAKAASTKELKRFLKVNAKVEELATSGKRQVTTAIELAKQAVESLDADHKAGDKDDGTLEELEAAAAGVSGAVTKFVVTARKGQKPAGEAASALVRALVGFVMAGKAIGPGVENEIRAPFVAAMKELGADVIKALKVVKAAGGTTKKSATAHKALRKEGAKVAEDVAEVLATGLVVSNPELAGEGSADAMAAKELKSTAKDIENSGLKKLNRLRPVRGEDGLMSFEEQLVEGCKTIMVAAAGLIKAAAMCQKEVMAHQAAGEGGEGSMWHTDTDFSTGLISAAQRVNAECKLLVTTAETTVKDKPENPALRIKAAVKGITASTAHLVVAAQVKAGDSKPQKLLKKAGGDVKRTAEALDSIATLSSAAAAAAAGGDDDDELDDEGQVAANKADMEARLRVLAAQQELEKARQAVLKRNKRKYKK
ncbi:uncharacterized protein AMSG_01954 [Thecamonas trahens ATCC 50062]|uniref:FERM domain-containing protein n=1 Tax=Thecamonas trahens ATCC 50062 TaxID=461836 RepID=A0A0L0DTV5_THETB|nr:hypothetical protein AMSG_01954 [Thecamonas trahens ATCC 50062]KNC55685.1 hypothetical protein AMSG_01954 [Thecamonas trahens ATCC 50062]|eukprot:XP_013761452.1 hypothetical protein AMSG_01954 [Thecamonas trahens ATCC 50062]